MQDPEGKKNHRSITISKDVYDKLVSMGNMQTSFNDIVTDIMKKANVMGASAATKEDE